MWNLEAIKEIIDNWKNERFTSGDVVLTCIFLAVIAVISALLLQKNRILKNKNERI